MISMTRAITTSVAPAAAAVATRANVWSPVFARFFAVVVVLTLVSILAPLSDLGLSGFVGVSGVSGSFEPSESVGPAVFTSVWSVSYTHL